MPAAPTPVEAFEHIIRRQNTKELVPFLLELERKNVVAVRTKTKSLHKELDEYTVRANGHWNRLMQPDQELMLFLAGLVTYSRKEAFARGFTFPSQLSHEQELQLLENRRQMIKVLEHARPDWLADWFERTTRANQWAAPDYSLLRELESRDLIAHHPWLFAKAAADKLNRYNWLRNFQLPKASQEIAPQQTILPDIQTNTVLLQRDLPLLFDFDTVADSALVYDNQRQQNTTWLTLLPQLAASGHLDRADLLTRCLLALRRDFRRPLLTWFKNLFLALGPTAAERLARQAELVELLAHPLPLVVNFALDQLKDLWTEVGFRAEALLLYADGLMTRPDLKTGVRTLLGGLGKLVKTSPGHATAIAQLCAAALAHADGAVQERAAKGLADLLNAKKPLLAAAEVADLTDRLNQYADLLAPAARLVLAPWLSEAAPAPAPADAPAAYEPRTDYVPDLSPATAIAPVADWHELLFLTGQVLRHDDPAALERWLEGLLRLRPHFPADCQGPLQPYLHQLLPHLQGKTETEQRAILDNPAFAVGYAGLAQALTLGWAGGFATPLVKRVEMRTAYQAADPLVAVEQQRLLFAEQLLRARQPLPLLSTPTHAPHWVAPTALVQRLLAYEAAAQEPNFADLAVALARTARAHLAEAAAARALLPQLRHEGLRELLHWLLQPAGAPLPAAAADRRPLLTLLKHVTERLGQLLPAAAAKMPGSLAESLPWLWAVAARIREPAADFPALAGLTAKDYPGVVRPWQPRWELQPKSNTYVEKWKPGQPEVTDRWTELRLLPQPTEGPAPSGLLLYSLHVNFKVNESHHIWHHMSSLTSDYPYLVALLPQYPAPLHWHALRLAATRDTVDSTTRELLVQALRSLLGPGPRFDEPAALLLAVGLTHNAPGCRALAVEVLLAAVAARRLEPVALGQALGQLLAAEFVPVQRLADGLVQARAINFATDDALRRTLDALLPQLPAEPMRNVRKLLEAYADLTARTRQPVPATVEDRLREWKASPSLKKVASALLS
ncbi:DUF6493 family protein [Hymenobacter sp.]|uniref:DUF6493 family protein n=1 Tax=Hymenobacter sp. TaxID=1898978 RepID=UPI002869FAA6|nr:DUF6493 family protein [Hymenobacter sp.]